MTRRAQAWAIVAASVAALTAPAFAQSRVTTSELQRVQDGVYLAGRDVEELRAFDTQRAGQLAREVEELAEEVVYLRVKLRKERSVTNAELDDVERRLASVRERARDRRTAELREAPPSRSSASRQARQERRGERRAAAVSSGSEFDVRLTDSLNSGTAQVEDRFEATTVTDFVADGRTVFPAGSVVRGVVSSVEPATRTNRTAKMAVTFDQISINGRAYPMRGTLTQAIEGSGIKGEAGRVGAGAGVGAIIGGLLGGVKGALAGVLIGGGGTIAATEGKEIDLPQGTVLRVRLDSPLEL